MGYKALRDANKEKKKTRHESIDKLHIALFNGTVDEIKKIIDDFSNFQIKELFEYCNENSNDRVIKFIINYRMDDKEFLTNFNVYYFCLKHNLYNELMFLVQKQVPIETRHMESIFGLIYTCSYNESINYFIEDITTYDVIIKFTKFDEINEVIELDKENWTYEHHINYKLLQVMKDVFEFEFIKYCKGQEFNWKNLLNFVMKDREKDESK